MIDTAVGELWRWCQEESPTPGKDKLVDEVREVIILLVRERARRLPVSGLGGALVDFGIGPNDGFPNTQR